MLATLLKQSFDPYFEAPIVAWEEFAEFCEPVNYEKEEIIKRQGESENYFYFIIEGVIGVFLWKESNFVCLDFAFDRHFCCDYMSLLTGTATPLEIVALEKSQMVRISKQKFDLLTTKSVGQIIRRISAEDSFVEKQQQQIELLTLTANERYELLIRRYPDIHQRIALKHIASYLGITPQSLSRIRKVKG